MTATQHVATGIVESKLSDNGDVYTPTTRTASPNAPRTRTPRRSYPRHSVPQWEPGETPFRDHEVTAERWPPPGGQPGVVVSKR